VSDEEEEDSEDLESEDEDGEELTPGVDAAILRMLAKIKRGDPEIYEAEKEIFEGGSLGLFESKTPQVIGQRSRKSLGNCHRQRSRHESTRLLEFYAADRVFALTSSSPDETGYSPSRKTRRRTRLYISFPLS
jgi:hypothetical protein